MAIDDLFKKTTAYASSAAIGFASTAYAFPAFAQALDNRHYNLDAPMLVTAAFAGIPVCYGVLSGIWAYQKGNAFKGACLGGGVAGASLVAGIAALLSNITC